MSGTSSLGQVCPTNSNFAVCGGQGEAGEALRLFRELLPDQQRVLGPYHPDTLATRNNIAYFEAE